MSRIHAFTISFPPRRFIGAELMTAGLLRELQLAGHTVSVGVGDGNGQWSWDGIPVSGSALDAPWEAPVVIVHAGRSWPGVEYRHRTGARLVMICHNTSEGVRDDIEGARPDLVIVNSETMRRELKIDKDVPVLVVNPPAPAVHPSTAGDRIVALSLNEMKGGRQFFELAEAMPNLGFLGVRGGYGKQVAGKLPNVEILEHVAHERLTEDVWSRAAVFLQLSSAESWGMAAAEAIAHGVPVVAHLTSGLRENLGDAAVWVDRDDVTAIAAAVRDILDARLVASEQASSRARENAANSRRQIRAWVNEIGRLADVPQGHRGSALGGVLAGRR